MPASAGIFFNVTSRGYTMDFPRLVYMNAAVHQAVNNEAEFKAAIAAGYYPSVPEALAKKLNPVPDTSVTVYKGRERHKAANQTEADALIAGDGWYTSQADALAALDAAAEAAKGEQKKK